MESLGSPVSLDALGVTTECEASVVDAHGNEVVVTARCWYPTHVYMALEEPYSEV